MWGVVGGFCLKPKLPSQASLQAMLYTSSISQLHPGGVGLVPVLPSTGCRGGEQQVTHRMAWSLSVAYWERKTVFSLLFLASMCCADIMPNVLDTLYF